MVKSCYLSNMYLSNIYLIFTSLSRTLCALSFSLSYKNCPLALAFGRSGLERSLISTCFSLAPDSMPLRSAVQSGRVFGRDLKFFLVEIKFEGCFKGVFVEI